jgi:hypothetical protein
VILTDSCSVSGHLVNLATVHLEPLPVHLRSGFLNAKGGEQASGQSYVKMAESRIKETFNTAVKSVV